MKYALAFFFIFPLILSAQNYPFDEGFTGIPTYSLPAGWSGDMRVMPDHGLNDDKGLVADISATDRVDSSFTPWVGPLDTFTEIIFWYRMVEDFIFPSTEKHLSSGDQLALAVSTDSINYTNIYVIDSSNHFPTINFHKVVFTLQGYAGQTVKFKWRAQWGAGNSYYTDIDSIKIRKDFIPPSSLNSIEEETAPVVYPNPCAANNPLTISWNNTTKADLLICDLNGREVLHQQIASESGITLPELAAGLYLVRVSDNRHSFTQKLLLTP